MKNKYSGRARKKMKVDTKRVTKTRALPVLSASATKRLQMLSDILGHLFADENFVTLLEAEALTAIPAVLRPVFEAARDGHEIGQ
jgi:hypothetical protein